jgi:hypothetical protein
LVLEQNNQSILVLASIMRSMEVKPQMEGLTMVWLLVTFLIIYCPS